MTKINLNQSPYFDDFLENKKYYRILFRPGRAVQARELNQIHSLIQNQLQRFGNNMFKPGTQILPGKEKESVRYINNNGFIKIDITSLLNQNSLLNTRQLFETYWKDKTITNDPASSQNPGIKAKVIGYRESDLKNEIRLYVDYTKTSDSGTKQTFIPGEKILLEATPTITANISSHQYAVGKIASTIIDESVYYINGNFVLVDAQRYFIIPNSDLSSDGTTILNPDGASDESQALWLKDPSAQIGLKVTESIVTYEVEPNLLDNALGTPNYSAPGADRLRISADLSQISTNDQANAAEFIVLLTVKKGILEIKPSYTEFNVIRSEMERRTYDESGDYSVIPFIAQVKEFLDSGTNNGAYSLEDFRFNTDQQAKNSSINKFGVPVPGTSHSVTLSDGTVYYYPGKDRDDLLDLCENRLTIRLDSGKAYVKGVEIEKLGPTNVDVLKSRTLHFQNGASFKTPLGAFFYVQGIGGTPTVGKKINLYSQILEGTGTGNLPSSPIDSNLIGTARLAAVEFDSGTSGTDGIYKLFLFDISINQGKDLAAAKSFYSTGPSFGGNIKLYTYKLEGSVEVTISGKIKGTGTSWRNDDTQRISAGDYVQVGSGSSAKFFKIASNPINDTELQIEGFGVNPFDATTPLASAVSEVGAGATIYLLYSLMQTTTANSTNNGYLYKLPDNYIYTLRGGKQDLVDDTQIDSTFVTRKHFTNLTYTTITENAIQKNIISATLSGNTETFESFSANGYAVISSAGKWLQVKSKIAGTPAKDVVEVDVTGKTVTVYLNSQNIPATNPTFCLITSVVKGAGLTGPGSNNQGPASSLEAKKILKKGYFDSATNLYVGDGYRTSTTGNVKELSLGKADVLRVTRIIASDSPTGLKGSGTDVTHLYRLDNGQRDCYYDIAKVILIPGSSAPAGKIRVEFDYFQHTGPGLYFSADSYTFKGQGKELNYEDIPDYVLPSGVVYHLASCVDFRPVVSDIIYDVDGNPTGGGLDSNNPFKFPTLFEFPKDSFSCDYHRYRGRKDKLYLNKDQQFYVKAGKPDVISQFPDDPDTGMVIYDITLDPYTASTNAVQCNMRDTKRYTMRDIGKLENRIKNLEYYTSLSMLEASTNSLLIPDANGQNKFKNGFLVDNFTNFTGVDTSSKDWKAAIDGEDKVCRPLPKTQGVKLVDVDFEKTNQDRATKHHQKTGDLYTLPYTEILMTGQKKASKVISVNPYRVFTFVGKVGLTPWTDEWRDVNYLEPLVVKDDSLYQAQSSYYGAGVHVDYKQTVNNWTGGDVNQSKGGRHLVSGGHVHLDKLNKEERALYRKTGKIKVPKGYVNAGAMVPADNGSAMQSKANKNTITLTGDAITTQFTSTLKDDGWSDPIDLGSRVVSTASAEFIRSRFVLFKAQCFKPTTKLYAFFDEKPVSQFCAPLTKAQYEAAKPLIDNMINPIISLLPFPWDQITGQDLKTDSTGEIYGVFKIPNNPEGTRFKTGDRIFRLTTSDNNGKSPIPESAGEVNYTARGWIENQQKTVMSTRLFHIERGATTSSEPISEEVGSFLTLDPPCPSDPIAQSFFVYEDTGCFVTKVDVYFFKKPSIGGTPGSEPETSGGIQPDIELQLRPLSDGGYPSNKIMPFGRVILKAHEVTTNYVDMTTKKLTITKATTDASAAPEINVLNTITSNNFVATTFKFESPIYLSPKTSYCLVLESQATVDYKVWIAQYGQDVTTRDSTDSFVVEGTFNNEIGTSNPINNPCYLDGTFFKSENSISWVADPSVDMMFQVHKAKFDISTTGEIDFVNTELPLTNVPLDGIITKEGSSRIRIMHEGHGHYADSSIRFLPNLSKKVKITATNNLSSNTITLNESVPIKLTANVFVMNSKSREARQVISVDRTANTITLRSNFGSLVGVTDLLFCEEAYDSSKLNGIKPEVLFHEAGFKIESTEMDYYVVDLGATAIDSTTTTSGQTGGENIFVTDNIRFEQLQLLTTSLVTAQTKIEWNVKTVSSAGVTDFTSSPEKVLPSVNLEPNQYLYFSDPMQILSYKGEEKLAGSLIDLFGKSLSVRAVLSSTSVNLSPVIDKSRMTVELTHNRIDSPYGIVKSGIDSRQIINDEFDIYNCVPNAAEGLPATTTSTPYANIINKIYFTDSDDPKTGKISCALDSRNVVGASTLFLTELRTGDKIRVPNGEERTITEIKSDTELTINTPFQSTQTSQDYYSNVSNMRIKTGNLAHAEQIAKLDVGKYVTIKIINPTSGVLISTSKAIDPTLHDNPKMGGALVLSVNYTPANTVNDPDLGVPVKAEVEFDYRSTDAKGYVTGAAVLINQKERFIDEIAPEGGSCSAKYTSKKLVVNRPSNALKIMFDGSRHRSCEFELYYKLESANGTKSLNKINWVRADFNLDVNGILTTITPEPNDSPRQFSAYECTLNNLPTFVGAQAKIVMRGGNPARTPKIMNFRMIILDE